MTESQDEQQTPPVAIGEPRAGESSVQPAALVEELIEHVKDEIKEIDGIIAWNKQLGVGSKHGDGKLRVIRQIYSDNVLCWLDQLKDKIAQVKHEAEHVAAG